MRLPRGAEATRLRGLLRGLGDELERLLTGGMTTATDATRQTLDTVFREASQRGLSRLGSTVRILGQEVGRYLAHDEAFSGSRLTLFLGRTWVLVGGLRAALERGDEATFSSLAAFAHRSEPVERLRAVTVGVAKKVITGLVCIFDFRLRRLDDDGRLGEGLSLTEMFPLAKERRSLPPEALLELRRPQKYKPSALLGGEVLTFHRALLTSTSTGTRLSWPREAEGSKVEVGEPFEGWGELARWDLAAARERVRGHEIDPLELPVELQEEVVLESWRVDAAVSKQAEEQRQVWPVRTQGLSMRAVASSHDDGAALRANLERLRKGQRPQGPGPGAKATKTQATPPAGRLFGLLHYETCALELQPLSLLTERGPIHLTISAEGIDRKALLRSLDLR